MRRRSSQDRQRSGRRRSNRSILIYCGGARTEPDYFEGLRRDHRRRPVTIKVRSAGVAPAALVQEAAAYRARSAMIFDEVWCVVDVDEFDLAAAVTVARREGVGLAVSNPCFELWLLLHYSECRRHCNGCADVQKRLRRQIPGYDKSRLVFDHFVDGISDAIGRAKTLDPTGTAYEKNPSSGIWQIVEHLLETR